MPDRYVCVHAHFDQPPRENPWLEAIEVEDSAAPYHDWTERVAAECYAANAAAPLRDEDDRVRDLSNNYGRISFDFGPTLLAWLEKNDAATYAAVLQADRDSRERFGGHGSALAHPYVHAILPLCTARDRATLIAWGLVDFERRFGRPAEGMWLPETAVDLTTLDALADRGLRFVILSPYQAGRVRPAEGDWRDVIGGGIDTRVPYTQRLPSGRSIAVFFYDGPLARTAAFDRLLERGDDFARRLVAAFDGRDGPQLSHVATDGETYGHHKPGGAAALAETLARVDADGDVRLTNYGEHLDRCPPTHEVELLANTAWSCSHGLGRWQRDCGCNGGRRGRHQRWRGPLRDALEWLRDWCAPRYEAAAVTLVADPWSARDGYAPIISDRSPATWAAFLATHADHELTAADRVRLCKLLEMQRQLLLMYGSGAWFFDDIARLETVQALRFAGRAMQLAGELFGESPEAEFVSRLARAPGNLPDLPDGRAVYDRFVCPARIDPPALAAHYAVASLFETFEPVLRAYTATVERHEHRLIEAGRARLLLGRATFVSEVTGESAALAFAALHLGDHNVCCGVGPDPGSAAFAVLTAPFAVAMSRSDVPEAIRLIDRRFPGETYTLARLFRDAQRRVLKHLLGAQTKAAAEAYQRLYEDQQPLMRELRAFDAPLPPALLASVEFLLHTDLRWLLGDSDPNFEQIGAKVNEALAWGVRLDPTQLAYKFAQALTHAARHWRDRPDDSRRLDELLAGLAVAERLPFAVDVGPALAAFFAARPLVAERERRAAHGDERARRWLEKLLDVGERTGARVVELQAALERVHAVPTTDELTRAAVADRRVPRATYRLQFHQGFTFRDAAAVVPYLAALGVSHVYASPILLARPGSTHGYDVCDHSRLNPELGTDDDFAAFTDACRDAGLGVVLDIVPNHMGISLPLNRWWLDVLENGEGSRFAAYFDIDWTPVNPDLAGKVLLPILGDQYGAVLEGGGLRLEFDAGRFWLDVCGTKLPIAPASGRVVLANRLDALAASLGADSDDLLEYQSILTALEHLPGRQERDTDKLAQRSREAEVARRRLAALAEKSPAVAESVAASVAAFNGEPGKPDSFGPLDALIDAQSYRPAFWRVASEEINYRRFFDINDLAAIREEEPGVFAAAHDLPFRWLAEGRIHGLRIDHPDGLWDPAGYFRQLQSGYVAARVRHALDGREPEGLDVAIAQALEASPRPPLYVVAEKILVGRERLPGEWAVAGTTGYDFLNAALGVFVNAANGPAFERLYSRFAPDAKPFDQLAAECKRQTMLQSMASEVVALSHRLDRLAERNRRYRDFTLNDLTTAVRETIAALPVYRTYLTATEPVAERDRRFIERAVAEARKRTPRVAGAVFEFLRATLLMDNLGEFAADDARQLRDWALRFQQLTGPVMAKGVEDTAFYVHQVLIALNEVGNHPDSFGGGVAAFHEQCGHRVRHWPDAMLATATHDTKRGEDTRARLAALTEFPERWAAAVTAWDARLAAHVGEAAGQPAPSANDRYLLYQTLVGIWPTEPLDGAAWGTFRERVAAYMAKATKEAKAHTSWINADPEYDAAVQAFVASALDDAAFRQEVTAFVAPVAWAGLFNSLGQIVLKLASPGVPDVYQGCEFWDFSLVDPDNRRPVDYGERRSRAGAGEGLPALLANLPDPGVKLSVTRALLAARASKPDLFALGDYRPLAVTGELADHVCAFARAHGDERMVVIVPRLLTTAGLLAADGSLDAAAWGDTSLVVEGGGAYTDALANGTADAGAWRLAERLGRFPFALYVGAGR